MSELPAHAAVLVADEVTFRYGGGPLIGPLDLALGPGLHRLLGANGSGKSTLLRCLSGSLDPAGGRVRVQGRDPVREVATRQLIGHAPYPDDLPDFLSVGRCLQALAAFRRCPGWRGEALAEALELPLGLRIGAGSAGQRRKAGLLAALVGDPPVLLLDEPWSALDVASTRVVVAWMESFRQERTVLFTTHGECPCTSDSNHALASSADVTRER